MDVEHGTEIMGICNRNELRKDACGELKQDGDKVIKVCMYESLGTSVTVKDMDSRVVE